jgi:hypothetical protein
LNLTLRFHQELITQKTCDLIEKGNKMFLWGCKCRSGKTYMIGGIAIKLLLIKVKLDILIITPAPTETVEQFTDGLFNKFTNFESFTIHNIKNSSMLPNIKIGANNIFIISKQLLQAYTNNKTIKIIKDLKLDVIAIDENHFTGTTDLSESIISSYSSNNTVKLFLTATYNKSLLKWNILPKCQFFWDLKDEQICKSIALNYCNIGKLKEKHGNLTVMQTINHFTSLGFSISEIFSCYGKMPDLHLITSMFDSEQIGYCFSDLFSLLAGKFINIVSIKTFLKYISVTIFDRVVSICKNKKTRLPFTQIWFLPSNNINVISKCLMELMAEDEVLQNYDVLCINRKNKTLAKNIKNEIHEKEVEAKGKGKLGLILLAGNMLALGITIDLCDLVMMLNDSSCSDKVVQQMFRCMTEGVNKKVGFVVDLNVSRILNTSVNYFACGNSDNVEGKIKHVIENNLINIDTDRLLSKQVNFDIIIKKLMDAWKSDPINNFKSLLRRLDNDYEMYDSATQKLINMNFTKSDRDLKTFIVLKDEGDYLAKIIKSKTNGKEKDEKKDEEKEKNEEEAISFTKDVLLYIIPLTCILTITDKETDLYKMLYTIKSRPILLDIFDSQCEIWWNKNGLIDLIKDIVSKFFNKNSSAYNISIQFKMSMKSLIDQPKELLELINDCLKPKDKEKKEYGEVFTPMEIVNEMLDKLPKSVWKNKDLKWFDPAAGMGNFPIAVYLRLMKGLKKVIASDVSRKRHIIENMLYMCELNKKNALVCKQIFNVNDKYKLNLHRGNTLKFSPKKIFGVDKFDIILGNPPYNKGGIRSHTGKQLGEKNETIWPHFVEKAFMWLKKDGYLVFITPLSWLKKSHSMHDIILEKHVVWLKLWDNIKSLSIINGKIPISLYVLHNKLNVIKNKTCITSEIQSKQVVTIASEYLDKRYSIPIAYHSIFIKLITYIEKNNLELQYNNNTVKSIGSQKKLPKHYTSDNMFAVDTYTIKDGIMVKKVEDAHPDAHRRKIIIANKASFIGTFIDNGRLSLTGNHKYYITGNKLNLLLKMFNYKFINIVSHYTKYNQDFLDSEAFEYLPDIRKLKKDDITETQFYKLVGFTVDEIKVFS